MAQVYPFRGVRYDPEKVGKIQDVVTPPYDVISKEAQESYYNLSPYNIIRLELGKSYSTDTDRENQYTRAAKQYRKWLQDGTLLVEDKPSLYFYEQVFTAYNQEHTRRGIICALKLEPYENNVVVPHEETLPKAKADRLKLMHHCFANFSSIFGIYNDEENTALKLFAEVEKNTPDISFTDPASVTHKVWVVQDPDLIKAWQDLLRDRQVYIADGHHRYETGLQFQKEMAGKDCKNCDKIMITLVNTYDPGLVVFPTYRLVHNVADFDPRAMEEQLSENYKASYLTLGDLTDEAAVEKSAQSIVDALAKGSKDFHNFAMYTGRNKAFMFSIPKTGEKFRAEKSPEWNSLDITVLQEQILNKQLGIGDKERAEGNMLAYTRDPKEALTKVLSGEFQASFFLNPTLTHEVIAVAGQREKMPQKSTYYYPKLITGLVINPLDI
jgi:uncharacterized protein (DUF1015 family)